MVQGLVENGAQINGLDELGGTPFHVYLNQRRKLPEETRYRDMAAESERNLDAIRWLIANGADPTIRDIHGVTPLMLLERQHLEIPQVKRDRKIWMRFMEARYLLLKHGGGEGLRRWPPVARLINYMWEQK